MLLVLILSSSPPSKIYKLEVKYWSLLVFGKENIDFLNRYQYKNGNNQSGGPDWAVPRMNLFQWQCRI